LQLHGSRKTNKAATVLASVVRRRQTFRAFKATLAFKKVVVGQQQVLNQDAKGFSDTLQTAAGDGMVVSIREADPLAVQLGFTAVHLSNQRSPVANRSPNAARRAQRVSPPKADQQEIAEWVTQQV
jgi:hypothetical protein